MSISGNISEATGTGAASFGGGLSYRVKREDGTGFGCFAGFNSVTILGPGIEPEFWQSAPLYNENLGSIDVKYDQYFVKPFITLKPWGGRMYISAPFSYVKNEDGTVVDGDSTTATMHIFNDDFMTLGLGLSYHRLWQGSEKLSWFISIGYEVPLNAKVDFYPALPSGKVGIAYTFDLGKTD